MSVIADVQSGIHEVAQKVAEVEAKLLPEAEKLAALEGNPVLDALLEAAHVPAQALQIAVDVLKGLADLYSPQAASSGSGGAGGTAADGTTTVSVS